MAEENTATVTSFADDALASTVMGMADDDGTSSESATPWVGAERYEVRRVVGEGGMGVVLEAHDRQFGRAVALKQLRRSDPSANLRKRFQLEALVTANLEHPGVPAVYERAIDEQGRPFYAMRLVRGQTFTEAMTEASSMEERLRLLPVVVRTAQTLAFAHMRGVVHRDIKPDNILVGEHGQTTLLDWGIAKVRGVPTSVVDEDDDGEAQAATTRHGAVMGTPAYMAPEQAAGAIDRIDERTDVFALGAILYHLLTGRPPYGGETVSQVVDRAKEVDVQDIDREASEAPAALRAIVKRAMSRQRDQRYQSAEQLVGALESFIAGALTGKESMGVRLLVNIGSALAALFMLIGLSLIVSAMPSLREMGVGSLAVIVVSVVGLVMSIIEHRTKGRYALSWLALAMAMMAVLIGIGTTGDGLMRVFTKLREPEILADAQQWRNFMTWGVYESISNVSLGMQLGAIQLLAWGIAKRRVVREHSAARQHSAARESNS